MTRPDGSAVRAVKIKAVFILLLLGGHDAARLSQEVSMAQHASAPSGTIPWQTTATATTTLKPSQWSWKWGYNNEQACHFSVRKWKCVGADGGCELRGLSADRPRPFSDQCRLSDAYMIQHEPKTHFKMFAGILKHKSRRYQSHCMGTYYWLKPHCKRYLQQMVNAVRFMSKAQALPALATSMNEEDREEQKRTYSEALDSLTGVLGQDGVTALRLKDKIQESAMLKKDPEGTVKKMMNLLAKLTAGSEEEKAAARAEIENMPSKSAPLSADEEKQCEANDEKLATELTAQDIDQDVDSMELVTSDEHGEEAEEPNGSSALEVRRGALALSGQKKLAIFVGVLVAFLVISQLHNMLFALFVYAFAALIGCGVYQLGKNAARSEVAEEVNGTAVVQKMTMGQQLMGYGKCVAKVLLFPIAAVGAGLRWFWKGFRSKSKSKSSSNSTGPSASR